MTRAHLHSVSQRRVQHGEHGQVGTQIRHHTAAQALTTNKSSRLPFSTQNVKSFPLLVGVRSLTQLKTYNRGYNPPPPRRHTWVNNLLETRRHRSLHFLPSAGPLRRAEVVWWPPADSCPAETGEQASKIERKQKSSGRKRDSRMTTQKTRYISVLSSAECLLTGCCWLCPQTLRFPQLEPAAPVVATIIRSIQAIRRVCYVCAIPDPVKGLKALIRVTHAHLY